MELLNAGSQNFSNQSSILNKLASNHMTSRLFKYSHLTSLVTKINELYIS